MEIIVKINDAEIYRGLDTCQAIQRYLNTAETMQKSVESLGPLVDGIRAQFLHNWYSFVMRTEVALSAPKLFYNKAADVEQTLVLVHEPLWVLDSEDAPAPMQFTMLVQAVCTADDLKSIVKNGTAYWEIKTLDTFANSQVTDANHSTSEEAFIRCYGQLQILRKTDSREVKTTISGSAWVLYCQMVDLYGYEVALELFAQNPYWLPIKGRRLKTEIGQEAVIFLLTHKSWETTPHAEKCDLTARLASSDSVDALAEIVHMGSITEFVHTLDRNPHSPTPEGVYAELSLPSVLTALESFGEYSYDRYDFENFKTVLSID